MLLVQVINFKGKANISTNLDVTAHGYDVSPVYILIYFSFYCIFNE